MISDIVPIIVNTLRNAGVENVYSAFDAIPIESKGRGIFTVVGIESCSVSAPIYSYSTVYAPFKAEIGIKVTAPGDFSMGSVYGHYSENIEPVLEEMSSLTCSVREAAVKYDSNINRLVLNIRMNVTGMSRLERRTS